MNKNKIQTGLRIPINQYEKLKEYSEKIGISINSLILQLIEIGFQKISDNLD